MTTKFEVDRPVDLLICGHTWESGYVIDSHSIMKIRGTNETKEVHFVRKISETSAEAGLIEDPTHIRYPEPIQTEHT